MPQNPTSTTTWQKVLNSLEVDLSPAVFNTFFRATRVLSCENNIYTIAVDDLYQKENLELRYYGQIKSVLDDITDTACELIFKIAPLKSELSKKEDALGPLFQKEKIPNGEDLAKKSKEAGLASFYTFQNFIIGANNSVAQAIAQSIANEPGKMYNPLFIYSGVGLGKTHLIQAIGNEIIKKHQGLKVIYCTGETFMNELLEAIANNKTPAFRRKFRVADVLIIDDVQFIAGRESTQEEFFNTFNTLYQDRRQVILASDRPPKEIPKLEARLSSRFAAGMLTRLDPPDLEMRIAILRNKRDKSKFTASDEVLETIARQVSSNIRELEGALLQVVSHAGAQGKEPSANLVFELLGNKASEKSQENAPKTIIRNVSNHYNILVKDLKGKSRKADIAFARQVCMYLLRTECQIPLEGVGQLLGGRDHTTILHGSQKIELMVKENKEFEKVINKLSTNF